MNKFKITVMVLLWFKNLCLGDVCERVLNTELNDKKKQDHLFIPKFLPLKKDDSVLLFSTGLSFCNIDSFYFFVDNTALNFFDFVDRDIPVSFTIKKFFSVNYIDGNYTDFEKEFKEYEQIFCDNFKAFSFDDEKIFFYNFYTDVDFGFTIIKGRNDKFMYLNLNGINTEDYFLNHTLIMDKNQKITSMWSFLNN